MATSSKRQETEARMIECQNDEFLNLDKITDYEDLKDKFKKECETGEFITFETDLGFNVVKITTSLP